MAARSYRFTPYRAPEPPAGTYDPALDSQLAASKRGLFDLTQDSETQGLRAQDDYGLQSGQVQRQGALNFGDLTRDRDRGLADLGAARSRGLEDYQRNVAQLTRNYQRLGDSQRQQRNAANVLSGGAALQAAAKRSANEAFDREPIDTGVNRFLSDNSLQSQRVTDDYGANVARNKEQQDSQLGTLGLDFQRGATDRTTALTRAQREASAFGLDTGAQRAYQAAGTGWAPPGRGEPGGQPSNEFVNPSTGAHYRVINGVRYDQFGRRIGRATG